MKWLYCICIVEITTRGSSHLRCEESPAVSLLPVHMSHETALVGLNDKETLMDLLIFE